MSEELQPIYDVYGAEPPLAIHIHAFDDVFCSYIGRYKNISDAVYESPFYDSASEARADSQRYANAMAALADSSLTELFNKAQDARLEALESREEVLILRNRVKGLEAELKSALYIVGELQRITGGNNA